MNEECISALYKEHTLYANTFSHSSIRALQPTQQHTNTFSLYQTTHATNEQSTSPRPTPYHRHYYESAFSFTNAPLAISQAHLEEKRILMQAQILKATSNIYHLGLGQCVSIESHTPLSLSNNPHDTHSTIGELIIIASELILQDSPQSSTHTAASTPSQSCRHILTLLPRIRAFIPNPKPKPKAPYHTQGIVIGEGYIQASNIQEAEESIAKDINTLYHDEYGRVRVRINCYANEEWQEWIRNQEQTTTQTPQGLGQDDQMPIHPYSHGLQEDTKHTISSNQTIAYRESPNTTGHTRQAPNSNHHQDTQASPQAHASCAMDRFSYSPFLRVLSPMASQASGFYGLPRVGDEVIISFLDDDIDKPYISGSLYSANTPKYTYPRYSQEIAQATMGKLSSLPHTNHTPLDPLQILDDTSLGHNNNHHLTIASSSIGADNASATQRNEITLKNQKDKEELYIRAQKDYTEEVGHNHAQSIKHNRTLEVGALSREFITLGHIQNIAGFKDVNVGAEYRENTLLPKQSHVGRDHTLHVGGDNRVSIYGESKESVGGDREVEIGGNSIESIQGDFSKNVEGNVGMGVGRHLSIHTKQNLHLSADDEIALTSANDLLFSSKQSLALRSDENLTINVKDLYAKSKQEMNYYASESINLFLGDRASIQLTKDEIKIKIKESELILDESGLSVNKPVNVRKK